MTFGKFSLQQFFCVDDGTDGCDGICAQVRTNQQGLGVVVGNTADAGYTAFEFVQITFKFCTEGCVFDVMDFALEAFFLAVQSHTAFFCTQVGMVVYAKENIQNAVIFTCYAKETAHDVPPIMYRKRLIIVFQKHISGEKLRCFYFIRKKDRIQQKLLKTDIENM